MTNNYKKNLNFVHYQENNEDDEEDYKYNNEEADYQDYNNEENEDYNEEYNENNRNEYYDDQNNVYYGEDAEQYNDQDYNNQIENEENNQYDNEENQYENEETNHIENEDNNQYEDGENHHIDNEEDHPMDNEEDHEMDNEEDYHKLDSENYYQENNIIGDDREDMDHLEQLQASIKNQNNEEPIYIMTLELEKGKSERVKIYANSNPSQLAYEFCRVNDLDFNALNYLTSEIEKLMSTFTIKNDTVERDNNEIIEVDEENNLTDKNNKQEEDEMVSQVKDKSHEVSKLDYYNQNDLVESLSNKESIQDNKKEIDYNNDYDGQVNIKVNENHDNNLIKNKYSLNNSSKENGNKLKNEELDINRPKYDLEVEKNSNNSYTGRDTVKEKEYNKEKSRNQDRDTSYKKEQQSRKNQELNEQVISSFNKKQNSSEVIVEKDIPHSNFVFNQFIDSNLEEEFTTNKENVGDIEQEEYSAHKIKTHYNNSQSSQNQLKLLSDEVTLKNNNLNQPEIVNRTQTAKNFPEQLYNMSSTNLNRSPSSLIVTNRKNMNIFDRLFHDSELRRRLPKSRVRKYNQSFGNFQMNHTHTLITNSQILKSQNKNSTEHLGNINYGEFLYYRGKLLKDEKLRLIAHKKSEIEEKDSENNTFKPTINKQYPIPPHKENQLYSYNNQENNRHKDQVIRTIREKTDYYKTFTFKQFSSSKGSHGLSGNELDIKGNSNQFNNNKVNSNKRNEELRRTTNNNYTTNSIRTDQESKILNRSNTQNMLNIQSQMDRKNQKLEKIRNEINSQFPFHPNINKNYQFNLNFQERQELFQESKERQRKQMDLETQNLVDENGYPFFKPRLTSKSKNYNRNQFTVDGGQKDVFTHNYEYAKRYDQDKQNLAIKYYHTELNHIHSESEAIFNKVKEESFRKLFQDLDADQDDLITAQCIGLKNIPLNIFKIINPIVVELKEENESLNEEEFVKAMNHLFEILNFEDKKELISYCRNKNANKKNNQVVNYSQPYDYKPKINKNSQKLAGKYDKKLIESASSNNISGRSKIVDSNTFFKISSFNNTIALDNMQNYTYRNYKQKIFYNI